MNVRTCLQLALLAATLPCFPKTAQSETSLPTSITATLQPYVDDRILSGAVTLVANRERVLATDVVGYADVEKKTRLNAESLFWIASMSKPITGTALMILVDEGKVNIDDPVEKYLPEFKGQWVVAEQDDEHMRLKRPAHPITVRNILSHTSGLAFKSAIETPTLDLLPLASRVQTYAMAPLQFEPDTKYQYSNEGINTAGRIIEVVSGMPYEKFLDERLFKPLGMTETTFWPTESQILRLAKAYKGTSDKKDIEQVLISQLRYPLSDPERQPMPGGGLFSTAGDLAKFCQMILQGGEYHGKRYLTEKSVTVMTSRHTPARLKESYGLGWSVGTDGSFGHGGALSTNMTIDPKKGLITIFLVQNAGWRIDSGKGIHGAFIKAATALYARPERAPTDN